MGEADQAAVESGEDLGCGSERLCALTRKEHSPEELIRFVASPAGEIVADVARKLPGRGVWLTCNRAVVEAAVKAKVFARSLKRPVTVPPDLPDRIDALLSKRVLEALALANKAGLVTAGFAQVEALIMEGGAEVLLHGCEAAADGRDKLDRKYGALCRQIGREPRTIGDLTIEQMSLAMGRSNVVHAALKTGGATTRFLREAQRLERYRSSLGSTSS